MFGRSILLLVPHPDDEVVACAATIKRAQQEGAHIFTLYLTHGCLARDTLWPWQRLHYDAYVHCRRVEGERAAAFLNLEPVGWSARPARQLWRQLDKVFAEITAAVALHGIDQLWLPAYEGGNPDHDALNALGQLFTRRLSVLEFAEYNYAGGQAQAQAFPRPDGSETLTVLTDMERRQKQACLALYASERNNLGYVGAEQECYRPLAAYDYRQPPHPGKLWYARFQWVPFRHPRVDFTSPDEVSRAIDRFLSAHQQRLDDKS